MSKRNSRDSKKASVVFEKRDLEPRLGSTFEPCPLLFEPRLQERVWGGRALASYGKPLPSDAPFGESWEISDVEGQHSRVAIGPYQGLSLGALWKSFPAEILGEWNVGETFPLLVKLLDAQQNLSVQVHPSDADLRRAGEPRLLGKTEAWVILEAAPGAAVIHGLGDGVDPDKLPTCLRRLQGSALEPKDEQSLFRWVPVKRGDVVFVPAGTVHALGAGIVLLEVQQTSDITYRLYDWGRVGLDGKPRTLHLDETEAVGAAPRVPCPFASTRHLGGNAFQELLRCEKFVFEGLRLEPESSCSAATGAAFQILSVLEGRARLRTTQGQTLDVRRGAVLLLPAVLGEYSLETAHEASTCLRVLQP